MQPVLGDRVWGRRGGLIDIAAVIEAVFGLAATLGTGVSMLVRGLSVLAGIDDSRLLQIILIVIAVLMTIISAVSGVSRGVRRLSETHAGL